MLESTATVSNLASTVFDIYGRIHEMVTRAVTIIGEHFELVTKPSKAYL